MKTPKRQNASRQWKQIKLQMRHLKKLCWNLLETKGCKKRMSGIASQFKTAADEASMPLASNQHFPQSLFFAPSAVWPVAQSPKNVYQRSSASSAVQRQESQPSEHYPYSIPLASRYPLDIQSLFQSFFESLSKTMAGKKIFLFCSNFG